MVKLYIVDKYAYAVVEFLGVALVQMKMKETDVGFSEC